jgi:NAD(P)H dehydrogenase (quinone)
MTIAVTGATGQLGRVVVENLKKKMPAADIIALVRSPAKAADLGVVTREADYDRPQTLDRALAGVETLLLISADELGRRVTRHRNVIRAAKRAGVGRIVYTSLLNADDSPLDLAADHLKTEAELKASGLSFTILRNGWYTENYTGSASVSVASGVLLGCAGNGKISCAPRADYAEAAAIVLTGDGHEGKTYELAGDEACTLAGVAAEISRQTGKAIHYKNLPEADYATALNGFGLRDGMAQAIAKWDVGAAKGGLFDDGHQLSNLIGRATTPLAVTVADTLTRVP